MQENKEFVDILHEPLNENFNWKILELRTELLKELNNLSLYRKLDSIQFEIESEVFDIDQQEFIDII